MSGTFRESVFDGDVSDWNVSSVRSMFARYSAGAPAAARELLVAKGWVIRDGGPVE